MDIHLRLMDSTRYVSSVPPIVPDTSRPPDRHDLTIARARAKILEDLEKEYGTDKARGEALRTALRREDLTRRFMC